MAIVVFNNLGQKRVLSEIMKHAPSCPVTQQQGQRAYLGKHEIARASGLREIGVSATAISRAVEANRLNQPEGAGHNVTIDANTLHVAGRLIALKIIL